MSNYETLVVLHPELAEGRLKENIERAGRVIESLGGHVDHVEEWGMRELAYPIQKLRKGYYVLLEHNSPAPVVPELERTFKISEDVLRSMTVIPPKAALRRPREEAKPAETGEAKEREEQASAESAAE